MKGKRTDKEFENFELKIVEQPDLTVHHLKKPDSVIGNVKFINTNGIMAVTGDYGNWMFCREFHPSADEYVSAGYWKEKLRTYSTQDGDEFSPEETRKQLLEEIDHGLVDYGYEDDELDAAKEFYTECLEYVDEKTDYVAFAYGPSKPSFLDYEEIPMVNVTTYRLLYVFDAFEEICRRVSEERKLAGVPELEK
jgi:hypothetical protein